MLSLQKSSKACGIHGIIGDRERLSILNFKVFDIRNCFGDPFPGIGFAEGSLEKNLSSSVNIRERFSNVMNLEWICSKPILKLLSDDICKMDDIVLLINF